MKNTIRALAALSCIACAAQAEDWTTSPYGADDEIGAANLLTPEVVKAAVGLVKEGRTYALGIPVGKTTPGFGVREFDVTILMPGQEAGATLGANKMSYVDDMITGWIGLGSQIDGLGHLGIDNTFYNGNRPGDFVRTDGLTKMGIHGIPPMVTRGVLLNIAKARGVEVMKEGDFISAEEVQEAVKTAGVTLRDGDVVLLHTGWLSLIETEPKRYAAGEPGIDETAAKWLADQGVVAVGADTWGLDAVPSPDGRLFTAHQELLARRGVYILENMDTSGLAADDAVEFLFVLGQPRFKGAVQSMINPVAIR